MKSLNNPGENGRVSRVLRDVRLASLTPVKPPLPGAGVALPPSAGSSAAASGAHALAKDVAREREESWQRGRLEGRAEALKELGQAAALLRSVAQAVQEQQGRLIGEADEQAVTLALEIARKILNREIQQPLTLQGLILRALAQAPVKNSLCVRLHPEDLRVMEQLRGQVQQAGERLPEDVVLVPDPAMERGGCVVESPAGSVDARLKTQLGLLEEALRGAEQADNGDGRVNAPGS